MATKSTTRTKKQRSGQLAGSLLASGRHKSATRKRALIKTLPLSSGRRVIVSLRRFTTHPSRRSVAYPQFVVSLKPLYPRGYKELALRLHRVGARRKVRVRKSVQHPGLFGAVSYSLMTVGLAGLIVSGAAFWRTFTTEPPVALAVATEAPSEVRQPEAAPPVRNYLDKSTPVRLRIPAIGVDAPIVLVGKQADGSMETPGIFDNNVGWYHYSPTPGELGPSVLTGHVDNYVGPSVFWKLGELLPGSEIIIDRIDLSQAVFVVESSESVDQNAFPTDKVYGDIDHAGLRLITCGGSFNYLSGRYSSNTIIYASLRPL